MSTLSDNIKIIRGKLDENQEEFAARMNVSLSQQKSYETDRSKPGILYMEELSRMTGISTTSLRTEPVDSHSLGFQMEEIQKRRDSSATFKEDVEVDLTPRECIELKVKVNFLSQRIKDLEQSILDKNEIIALQRAIIPNYPKVQGLG